MHVEAWGLNHSLYLPYVMHGRPSVAASFSLRPQDSLWDGAHDARLTGDVVDEILGGKVDRADWSVAPDDPRTGARPRHKSSLPYRSFCSSCRTGRNARVRPVFLNSGQWLPLVLPDSSPRLGAGFGAKRRRRFRSARPWACMA